VARQENPHNDELFDSSGAHLVARRSLIVARRILAVATTPLLQAFIDHMIGQDDDFAQRIAASLGDVLHDRSPSLWTLKLDGEMADGIKTAGKDNIDICLTHITHNTRTEEERSLDCVCLVLQRGAMKIFLPEPDRKLLEGDHLLFAGRGSARREMIWALLTPTALMGYATGLQIPRGAIARWLWQRRRNSA
jgi:hypothetical protein